MPVVNSKFSDFADGGDLANNDIVVGLRNGINTRFTFAGATGVYLPLAGGTMSGNINMANNEISNLPTPTNAADAATKGYVDSLLINNNQSCLVSTTANLAGYTYNNGSSGVGSTLTAGSNGAFSSDGVTPAVNSRILVAHQSTQAENGIYVLTQTGDGSNPAILTRATDYDETSEINGGDIVPVISGTLYQRSIWMMTQTSAVVVGTTAITFAEESSPTDALLSVNNLSDVANATTSFNNISPLTTKGDLIGYSTQNVRLAVGSTNGQMLQVNSGAATGLAWSTATYPTTTTANQILYSSATNTITELATTAGGVLVTDASSVPQFLANPAASGKLLASVNAAIPIWTTPTYPTTSGTAGKVVISDGTNNVYSTPTFPNASATSGKLIQSDGTNWIASTPTYPSAAGTLGNLLTSDGTNWVSSAPANSGTVNSGTANQLAYYATTGTAVSGLTSANNGILVTSNTGVPSISTTFGQGLAVASSVLSVGGANNIPFNDGNGIQDSNGNLLLSFTKVASAVNYIRIFNNSTLSAPSIVAGGSDSAIGLSIQTKNSFVDILDSTGTIAPSLRLKNAANTHYTALKVATAAATDLTLTLPSADGQLGAPLITDSAGTLSFGGTFTDISGTVTVNGFSATTVKVVNQLVVGKQVFLRIAIVGTSNATTFTITNLPYAAASPGNYNAPCLIVDNSTNATGLAQLNASATTLSFFATVAGGAFTNSGSKQAFLNFWYERT